MSARLEFRLRVVGDREIPPSQLSDRLEALEDRIGNVEAEEKEELPGKPDEHRDETAAELQSFRGRLKQLEQVVKNAHPERTKKK